MKIRLLLHQKPGGILKGILAALVTIGAASMANAQTAGQPYFVTTSGAGTGDGSTWANAAGGYAKILAGYNAQANVYIGAGNYTATAGLGPNTGTDTHFLRGGYPTAGGTGTDTTNAYNPVTNATIIDCQSTVHFIKGTTGAAVITLRGLTIQNSVATPDGSPGGVYCAAGPATQKITFDQCSFLNNKSTSGYGGVTYIASISTAASFISIRRCYFSGNSPADEGGAIAFASVTPVGYPTAPNTGQFMIDSCSFVGNHSPDQGGALFFTTTGGVTVKNSSFCSNTAVNGAAIEFTTGYSAIVSNCTFRANAASTAGNGAIYHTTGNATYDNITFYQNTAAGSSTSIGADIEVNGSVAPGFSLTNSKVQLAPNATNYPNISNGTGSVQYTGPDPLPGGCPTFAGVVGPVAPPVGIFYNTSPGNWQWRNNDSTEAAATAAAIINTPLLKNDSAAVRLRQQIYANSNVYVGNLTLQYAVVASKGGDSLATTQFYYDTTGTPSYLWKTVGTTGTDWVMAGADTHINDTTVTNRNLLGKVGAPRTDAFGTSAIYATTSTSGADSIPANKFNEIEYSIKPGASVQKNVVYYFRLLGANINGTSTPDASFYQSGYPNLVTGAGIAQPPGNSTPTGINLAASIFRPTNTTFTSVGAGGAATVNGVLQITNSSAFPSAGPISGSFTVPLNYTLTYPTTSGSFTAPPLPQTISNGSFTLTGTGTNSIGFTSNTSIVIPAGGSIKIGYTIAIPASATAAANATYILNNGTGGDTYGVDNVVSRIFITN